VSEKVRVRKRVEVRKKQRKIMKSVSPKNSQEK